MNNTWTVEALQVIHGRPEELLLPMRLSMVNRHSSCVLWTLEGRKDNESRFSSFMDDRQFSRTSIDDRSFYVSQ